MSRVTREERGWAAHYCCAHSCHFRRNTLLTRGNTRIVVSTVGAHWAETRRRFTTIGRKRYYETMVFHAKREHGIYWDADIGRQLPGPEKWGIDHCAETADMEANDMHEAAVAALMADLAAGKRFPAPAAEEG